MDFFSIRTGSEAVKTVIVSALCFSIVVTQLFLDHAYLFTVVALIQSISIETAQLAFSIGRWRPDMTANSEICDHASHRIHTSPHLGSCCQRISGIAGRTRCNDKNRPFRPVVESETEDSEKHTAQRGNVTITRRTCAVDLQCESNDQHPQRLGDTKTKRLTGIQKSFEGFCCWMVSSRFRIHDH